LRFDHRPEVLERSATDLRCFAIAKWDEDVPGHWSTPGGFPYCATGGQVYLTPVSEQGT
jgi:hypothetical protein